MRRYLPLVPLLTAATGGSVVLATDGVLQILALVVVTASACTYGWMEGYGYPRPEPHQSGVMCTRLYACEPDDHTLTWPCEYAPGTGRLRLWEPMDEFTPDEGR